TYTIMNETEAFYSALSGHGAVGDIGNYAIVDPNSETWYASDAELAQARASHDYSNLAIQNTQTSNFVEVPLTTDIFDQLAFGQFPPAVSTSGGPAATVSTSPTQVSSSMGLWIIGGVLAWLILKRR